MFGTSLDYRAIRILGMDAYHPVATKARGFPHNKLCSFATRLSSDSGSFLVFP